MTAQANFASSKLRILQKCYDRSSANLHRLNLARNSQYFPRYLLICLQRWIHHNQHTLYQQLKHASHSIDQIAQGIAAIQPQHNHTTVLAEAHQLLRQNYRRKNSKTPSNQITLGL